MEENKELFPEDQEIQKQEGTPESPQLEEKETQAAGDTQQSQISKKAADGKGKRRISKQLLAVIIAVAVVLLALATVLIVNLVRDNTPPELESVRERLGALIEASYEVNPILFGDGLPTYPRVYEDVDPFTVSFEGEEYTSYYFTIEDEAYGKVIAYQYYIRRAEGEEGNKNYVCYDILTGGVVSPLEEGSYRFAQKTKEAREGYLHHDEKTGYYYYLLADYKVEFVYEDTDDKYYDYVRADCPYQSTDDIKAKASAVYSAEYLTQIYENLFTGVAFSENDNGVLYARYRDYEEDGYTYLQECNAVSGMELPDRRYDLSTMKMTRDSKAKYIVIELESYIVGQEEVRTVVELSFALENGSWFLDSPTY